MADLDKFLKKYKPKSQLTRLNYHTVFGLSNHRVLKRYISDIENDRQPDKGVEKFIAATLKESLESGSPRRNIRTAFGIGKKESASLENRRRDELLAALAFFYIEKDGEGNSMAIVKALSLASGLSESHVYEACSKNKDALGNMKRKAEIAAKHLTAIDKNSNQLPANIMHTIPAFIDMTPKKFAALLADIEPISFLPLLIALELSKPQSL